MCEMTSTLYQYRQRLKRAQRKDFILPVGEERSSSPLRTVDNRPGDDSGLVIFLMYY